MESAFALSHTKAGSLFYNYKHFFPPLVLQGLADSESRLIFINIGAFGKQSDGGTFSGSTLYHFLEDLESTLQNPASFDGSGTEMSFVILGDKACPLNLRLLMSYIYIYIYIWSS